MPIRQQLSVEVEKQAPDTMYLQNVQMYIAPPSGHIKVEELQQWCVDRLRVLMLVEQISMQNYRKSSVHCKAILIKELEKNGLSDFALLINAPDYESQGGMEQRLRRNDCMSHFISRSAFSFEPAKRVWFFKQETRLFKWRFSSLDKEGIEAFKSINGLRYTAITKEEKKRIEGELSMSLCDPESIDNAFYKIKFTSALSLVAKRRVFLKDGIAYVPEAKMSSVIISEFKKRLNEGFVYSREAASSVYGDERITAIFSLLPRSVGTQYFKFDPNRQVNVNELDELSRTSYPLCMKLLHEALRTNHHLTNGGRVQYCLFLKGIGLCVDDALQFWKNEFVNNITESMFRKQYRYNIRHLYGQEGKRAGYLPFSCAKILNAVIGLRDNHGCPFKHMTLDVLTETLSKCGLVQPDIESVTQLSKQGSYQNACRSYYEITHNCIIENTFDHPNIYFDHSCKVFEDICSDGED